MRKLLGFMGLLVTLCGLHYYMTFVASLTVDTVVSILAITGVVGFGILAFGDD